MGRTAVWIRFGISVALRFTQIPKQRRSSAAQGTVAVLVDRILAAKKAGDGVGVAELEKEIDKRVAGLYGL